MRDRRDGELLRTLVGEAECGALVAHRAHTDTQYVFSASDEVRYKM
jgi:hypothetical protein